MSVATGFPRVAGVCPGCGLQSLFLADGGHVTCSSLDCPVPCAADEALYDGRALTFDTLREANTSRKVRWHGEADEWSGADWSNAMCGEAGEAANVVKKLRRHETRTGASYNTPDVEQLLPALAEELADVVTYADLLADKYGIDLATAVVAKFNRVSAAQGFPERLP